MDQTFPQRCTWCGIDPLYVAYHDTEWGVPLWDSKKQFEFLVLETFQSGLSWITILKRRDAFRKAFAQFQAETIAPWGPREVELLLGNAGIIRNRRKIEACLQNARATVALEASGTTLNDFLWSFVEGQPVINHWSTPMHIPSKTNLSDRVAQGLKQKGFTFIGSTTVYAHLQAAGLVNDHLVSCPRHAEVQLHRP